MARKLRWRSSAAGVEVELTDYIGFLGPARTFVLAQLVHNGKPAQRYELVSCWIPCKDRRQLFSSPEAGQHAAQTIVDKFAAWIGSGA